MNRQYGPKRMRSARAPLMRAGVMMANMPWYMQWTKMGMFVPGKGSPEATPCRPSNEELQPIQPPCVSPKARA